MMYIYQNNIHDNNGENFSAPGNVNMLPPGTGLLVMAHRDVRVDNNLIHQHKTMSVGVLSWMFTGNAFSQRSMIRSAQRFVLKRMILLLRVI